MVTATRTAGLEEQIIRQLGFKYHVQAVPLSKIDGDSSQYNYRQLRLDEELALQYGIAMENGAVFPPIVLHSEKGYKGYQIDSGIHRFHGRRSTTFTTIDSIILDELDLTDEKVAHKLDLLRIRLNLTHGRTLDQAERKMIACDWVENGVLSEAEAAGEFDLDPKALHAAIENYELDKKLRVYGLHPENFVRVADKRAVLRPGIDAADMKAIERLIVRYSAENVQKKITSVQIGKLAADIAACRTGQETLRVYDEFNAEMAKNVKGKPRGWSAKGIVQPPTFRLNGILTNLPQIDTKAFAASQTNAEMASVKADEIYAGILKLAALHEALATKYTLPKVSVIR